MIKIKMNYEIGVQVRNTITQKEYLIYGYKIFNNYSFYTCWDGVDYVDLEDWQIVKSTKKKNIGLELEIGE